MSRRVTLCRNIRKGASRGTSKTASARSTPLAVGGAASNSHVEALNVDAVKAYLQQEAQFALLENLMPLTVGDSLLTIDMTVSCCYR